MPDRIFLTGASGYIGGAVAATLRASGYEIVALVRSSGAATRLESAGFTVLRGDLADAGGLTAAARACDAVVHAAMQWGERAGALDDAAVTAMLDAMAGTDKTFLYTSGVWVFGSTGGRIAGESAPVRPPPVVAWRPAVERRVLDARERKVRGIVVSPAHVHGRGGGMGPKMVRQARETGVVRMVGDGSNHVTFVHIDDLADLYLRALERSAAGELYIAAHGPAIRLRDVADAAARAGGGRVEPWPLEEARRKLGPIADALVLDQRIASTKAGRLLGWVARGPGVLEELHA